MKKIILFGAGDDGKSALKLLGDERVFCFCDNQKYGTNICGKRVISFAHLQKIFSEYLVVVCTRKKEYISAIVQQLEGVSIPFVFIEKAAKDIYQKEMETYISLNTRDSFQIEEKYLYPILLDKFQNAGDLGSYFWQDLWAAQKIFQDKPEKHYDIGSRIDGFISHLLSFDQHVVILDIRPLEIQIHNLEFIQCDATNLDAVENESIKSLSALCSLEHFGLGRYGDPIDPEGCFKCFEAIQRKLQKGGKLYISVPIGKEHLEFNAHRVFYVRTIIDSFSHMKLLEFSATKGNGIITNISSRKFDGYIEKGGDVFGLFMFEKK